MSTDDEREASPDGATGPTAWADVRQADVLDLLTPGDVRRANLLGRAMIGMAVLITVVLHVAAALGPAGTGTPDPQLVTIMLGAEGFAALAGAVIFTLARNGVVPKAGPLPPPPAGGLDHEALGPFLGRDVVSRMLGAAGVVFAVLMGASAHFLFMQQQMPLAAPADLVTLAPAVFAVIYAAAAGTDRDALAADLAEQISSAAEDAELARR